MNDNSKIFNGEIVFEISTEIKDDKRFTKELENHIKKRDSIDRKNNPKEFKIWGSKSRVIQLFLDPREDPSRSNSFFKPMIYKYNYTDSLITYFYQVNFSKYKVNIDTKTNDYKKYNIKTGKLIETKKHKAYSNQTKFKEIVYKDSIKNILGFDCYKVFITDIDIDSIKSYKEMYVTEKIKNQYYPIQIRNEILQKYFPLEVKSYSDFLSDKKTVVKTISIQKFEKQ